MRPPRKRLPGAGHAAQRGPKPWVSVWPPVSPAVYLRAPRRPLPFPLEEPGCRLYMRARQGLFHGLRELGLGSGDVVLMPAYQQGSEIAAVTAAGVSPRFYEGDDELRPDERELAGLLDERVRALYLIHYLGFPQDAPRWRRWCHERGLMLIEDAAQSWLAQHELGPVGSFGDLAIFCLYKMVGLWSGGAAVSTTHLSPAVDAPRAGLRDLARAHAAWVEQHRDIRGIAGKRVPPTPEIDPEDEFTLGDPDAPPTRAATFAIPRLAVPAVAERRRANYRRLLAELGDLVPPPFDRLPDGASPLQLPVRTPDKARTLAVLAHHGVEGAKAWPVGHPSLSATHFPRAEVRRRSTVGLPVHHGLGERELVRVIAAARAALG